MWQNEKGVVRKNIKYLCWGVVLFLLGIQFYQPARNIDNGHILPTQITQVFNLPENVQYIFKTSCYDCHSNNTRYPWYSYLQPARFIMELHIKEGKINLNFSEFGNYSKRKQENKLEAIIKQIKSDEMPLTSYTILHRNSALSIEQKEIITNWIYTTLKKY